jgi:hypothetical protein
MATVSSTSLAYILLYRGDGKAFIRLGVGDGCTDDAPSTSEGRLANPLMDSSRVVR